MLHRAAANCRLHYAKPTVMRMRRDFEQAACHDLHEADLWAGTALTNAVACTAWHWLSWHAKGLLMLFDTISPPAFAPRSGVGLKAKAPHVALLPAGARIDCRVQALNSCSLFPSGRGRAYWIGPRAETLGGNAWTSWPPCRINYRHAGAWRARRAKSVARAALALAR